MANRLGAPVGFLGYTMPFLANLCLTFLDGAAEVGSSPNHVPQDAENNDSNKHDNTPVESFQSSRCGLGPERPEKQEHAVNNRKDVVYSTERLRDLPRSPNKLSRFMLIKTCVVRLDRACHTTP